MLKQAGQLIRINDRGTARVLNGKAGMMFLVEKWVGVDDRCAAVLDYRYPDRNAAGGFQCWTIEPDGFEIIREAPASGRETSPEIASLAARILGEQPRDDDESFNALLVQAKRLAGSALSQAEPDDDELGPRVVMTATVDWSKITNAITGFVEGGYSRDWTQRFDYLREQPSMGLAEAARGGEHTVWYNDPSF